MNAVGEVGVVPIGGPQTNVVITAATAIVVPTALQRAQVGGPGTEFAGRGTQPKATGILVMWLTVELQSARMDIGVAPTTANGLLIQPTVAPIVFTGERLIRALQFISTVAGGTISYRFFFKDNN